MKWTKSILPCDWFKIALRRLKKSHANLNVLFFRVGWGLFILLFVLLVSDIRANRHHSPDYVILLHGLSRTKQSMAPLEKALSTEGYLVVNVDYPSREKTIERLATDVLSETVAACRKQGAKKIHFVSHSMGGIMIRYYLKHNVMPELGRVVMIAPPNGGSEIVDTFKNNFIFKQLNGPAGQQLGTAPNSLPRRLGPVYHETGVIAGDRTINFFLSLIIPGADDGKVSVKNARVDGMTDYIILHASHPFIMKNRKAIAQTLFFLNNGKFKKQ